MNISATLDSFEIIKKRDSEKLKTYNFGLGENPFRVPFFLLKSLQNSVYKKGYSKIDADGFLKTLLINRCSSQNYKVSDILFANGSKELLFMLQMVFDGVVILVSPYWVSYMEHAKILNKTTEIIETTYEDGYKLTPGRLESVCEKHKNKPKLLIFNSPNNPTGVVYSNIELAKISEVVNKNGLVVLSDEIYSKLNYSNFSSSTISYYSPRNTIRCTSLSKIFGTGGWRCGWCTFPKELSHIYEKMKILGISLYSCVSTPFLDVVKTSVEYNIEDVPELQKNKHFFKDVTLFSYKTLVRETSLRIVKPQAAWYMFLDFEEYREKLNKIGINNSDELRDFLLEKKGFLAVSGSKFGCKNMSLRVSCVDIDLKYINCSFDKWARKITEGIFVLVEFLGSL